MDTKKTSKVIISGFDAKTCIYTKIYLYSVVNTLVFDIILFIDFSIFNHVIRISRKLEFMFVV